MNKKLLVAVGVVIATGITLLFLVFWRSQNTKPSTLSPGQGTTSSSFPTPGPETNPDNTISIKTENGGSIQTKDFIHDAETEKDMINPGHYHLGYRFTEGGNEKIPYAIDYIDTTDFFNIVLYQEPIVNSRRDAEQYLMQHLGISQDQMCSLRYMVGVPYSVNEFYTATSLGFSFCPGSVQIPE